MRFDAESPVESFAALSALPRVRHGFVRRIPGLDVATDREEALARLETIHQSIRAEGGFADGAFVTAEQVHGGSVSLVDQPQPHCFAAADGLVTNLSGVSLGIYVADCCAVFLVDPVRRAIGLVHSGKKGTEQTITAQAIALMGEHFSSEPRDLVVQLSPCIRPPHYEVDFAAEIVRQVHAAGVEKVHDAGQCTACDLEHYYSYRVEKGQTGRMLALLALE